MSPAAFNEIAQREVPNAGENADAVFALLQSRTTLPSEIGPAAAFFFNDEYEYDPKAVKKKLLKDGVFQTLEKVTALFESLESFDEETVDKALHHFVEESGIGFGAVMPPIRISVSGQQSGPDLAPVLAILGKEKVRTRIDQTIKRFELSG